MLVDIIKSHDFPTHLFTLRYSLTKMPYPLKVCKNIFARSQNKFLAFLSPSSSVHFTQRAPLIYPPPFYHFPIIFFSVALWVAYFLAPAVGRKTAGFTFQYQGRL